MEDKIIIKGAKEHNLKNVDLELPRNKFIVFTGLSGSGKSSLAFDTIYAEGQRRYVESLSAYARQFLGQMEKPNVEYIEGLSPAISIDQKTTSKNPRSTVGTVTEIYDYLRLLFARVGEVHCSVCGAKISQMTIQEIVDKMMEFPERTKLQILSPVVRGQKGTHKKLIENIKKEGFVRIRVNGENYEVTDEIDLSKNKKHNIEVVVDRIVIKDGIESRLTDSIETAVKLSDGLVMSKKSITLSEMVSHRKRNQGYGDFSDVAGSGSTISKLLFGEYVLEHFRMASDSLQSGNGNYNSGDSVGGDFVRGDSANEDFGNGNLGDMAGAGSLDYELEYILEGHASDRENMETVASKLLMVRFVPDYAYIQTDSEKKAEAEAAALTLCTVIGLPELAEGAAQGILLAWAYGEAIMDIRTLISGGKVPLVKNAEDWKLSLSGLMQLGSTGENVAADSGKDMESGLAYREYLRMLLFLKSQDEVGMRTLDMVEQNLKIRYGKTFFRADACISRVEFHSTCNLRRGIMYDFPTYFGYN